MGGIVLCALAGLCALVGWALYLLPPSVGASMPPIKQKLLGSGFWYGLALLLVVAALLWGNIGVIYSHAGLTG